MIDYKGNGLLFDQKGANSLNMKSVYCDCDIKPSDDDNTRVGSELM